MWTSWTKPTYNFNFQQIFDCESSPYHIFRSLKFFWTWRKFFFYFLVYFRPNISAWSFILPNQKITDWWTSMDLKIKLQLQTVFNPNFRHGSKETAIPNWFLLYICIFWRSAVCTGERNGCIFEYFLPKVGNFFYSTDSMYNF